MPQMAPLSWLILFSSFSFLFALGMMKIFFIFSSAAPSKEDCINTTMTMSDMEWKW
uniref:ATP synthase complex subunit 8 n=1 Tax=Cryptopygus terranovus TaxID=1906390 RepID=A0A343A7X5_9HEXA|nr:ATP synthase F0 subunit 8 [Cryptopygus terranovus]APC61720.1 ATP synthase F0 subunit 8 [Cryptopygus terranovus]